MEKEVRAISKFIRISARKARLAAALIRKSSITEASNQLKFSHTKASRLLLKTLNSAIANAENNHSLDRDKLLVKEVRIDEGPTMKRAKSKCRGGRTPILKRTSHFTVVLGSQ